MVSQPIRGGKSWLTVRVRSSKTHLHQFDRATPTLCSEATIGRLELFTYHRDQPSSNGAMKNGWDYITDGSRVG